VLDIIPVDGSVCNFLNGDQRWDGNETHDEIHVVGEPEVAVCADSQTPGHQVAHASGFQGGNQGLEAREFHDPEISFVYI